MTLQDLINTISEDPSQVREALELIKRQIPAYPEATEAADADFIPLTKAGGGTEKLPLTILDQRSVTPLPNITSLSSLNTAALVDGQQFSVKDGDKIRLFGWNEGTENFDEFPVVTDADSVTGSGTAIKSDVLGTVSQSGGVPTGAIIERGSNSNGEYVKFADGTMICKKSIELDLSGEIPRTSTDLPAFFSSSQTAGVYTSCGANTTSTTRLNAAGSVVAGVATAGVIIYSKPDRDNDATPTDVQFIAIGRWF